MSAGLHRLEEARDAQCWDLVQAEEQPHTLKVSGTVLKACVVTVARTRTVHVMLEPPLLLSLLPPVDPTDRLAPARPRVRRDASHSIMRRAGNV